MAMRCFNCGKGIMVGRQSRHHPGIAGAQWKKRAQKTLKVFRPNLHWARIMIGGNKKRVRLCTKCLRLARQAVKQKTQPTVPLQAVPVSA